MEVLLVLPEKIWPENNISYYLKSALIIIPQPYHKKHGG